MTGLIQDLLVKWPIMLGLLVVLITGSIATGTDAAKAFFNVSLALVKVIVGLLVGVLAGIS